MAGTDRASDAVDWLGDRLAVAPEDRPGPIDWFDHPRAVTVVVTIALAGLVYGWAQLVGVGVSVGFLLIDLPQPVVIGVLLLAIEIGGFGVASLVYVLVRNLDRAQLRLRLPGLYDLAWIVVGTGTAVIVIIAVGLIAVAFGVQPSSHEIQQIGEDSPAVFLVGALLSIPVIGAMEELFYRGIVQGTLDAVLPVPAAIGIASVCFALVHIPSYLFSEGATLGGATVSIAVLVLLGVVLGTSYELSDNLVVPIVIHGAFNAFQFLLAFLRMTIV
ncbi:MAG: CPBP family intramembrane glutamic endopeptidase [Halococcoides sp.]